MTEKEKLWVKNNRERIKKINEKFCACHPDYHKKYNQNKTPRQKYQHAIYVKNWMLATYASVYYIRCLINNRMYIGSTTINPEKRWYNHIKEVARNNHLPLYQDIKQYGKTKFEMVILFTCKKVDARFYEQYYQDLYKNKGIFLYNKIRAMNWKDYIEWIPQDDH